MALSGSWPCSIAVALLLVWLVAKTGESHGKVSFQRATLFERGFVYSCTSSDLWTLRIRTSGLRSISSRNHSGNERKGSLPTPQESCGPCTRGLHAAVRQPCRTSTVTSWRLSRRSTLLCAMHAHVRSWYCACNNTQNYGGMLR